VIIVAFALAIFIGTIIMVWFAESQTKTYYRNIKEGHFGDKKK
jgi:hypothetical protein